jgi:hypothetical protein
LEVPVFKLNSKTLTIAGILLLVLALLFMATPLLRGTDLSARSGIDRQFNGQNLPGGQNGFPNQGSGEQGQGFTGPNSGTQNPGSTTNPARQFAQRGGGLPSLGFLRGITGTIVYAIALLASLVAAVGMFITRRWGQVIGIIMAILYLILGLVGFIPMILLSFMRGLNGLSLGLSILQLVLAVVVIVLALIPAKKVTSPAVPNMPTDPPVANA